MKKTLVLIINLLTLCAAALAGDRPPTKVWEFTCPVKIQNYWTSVDGRGGIVVSDVPSSQLFWFDTKGKPVQISASPGSVIYPIRCTPTSLMAMVSGEVGGFHYNLRRYKRDGTYTEAPEPLLGPMSPLAQPNDSIGCFAISADSTKLIRFRY